MGTGKCMDRIQYDVICIVYVLCMVFCIYNEQYHVWKNFQEASNTIK